MHQTSLYGVTYQNFLAALVTLDSIAQNEHKNVMYTLILERKKKKKCSKNHKESQHCWKCGALILIHILQNLDCDIWQLSASQTSVVALSCLVVFLKYLPVPMWQKDLFIGLGICFIKRDYFKVSLHLSETLVKQWYFRGRWKFIFHIILCLFLKGVHNRSHNGIFERKCLTYLNLTKATT